MFALVSSVFFIDSVLYSSEGDVEDLIKCELIGGGSTRHLNTFF